MKAAIDLIFLGYQIKTVEEFKRIIFNNYYISLVNNLKKFQ